MDALRPVGFVLFAIGFVMASFFAVRQTDSVGAEWLTIQWGWYANGFVVCLIGVVIIRLTGRSADTHADKVTAGLQDCEESIERIAGRLSSMFHHRETIDVYDVHRRIDDEIVEDLAAFANARESMEHRFGLQPYVSVMSRFALGERNVNRAWSASADGYIDEVWKCISRAEVEMSAAKQLLADLHEPPAS
jgi:hypothetical protein